MTPSKPVLLALACVTLAAAPATAQTMQILTTSVQCTVIPPFHFCALFGCTDLPQQVSIRNSLSYPIAANTLYTYTLAGYGPSEYRHPAALAPGETFSIEIVPSRTSTTCTAIIPGSPVVYPLQNAPLLAQ